MYFISLFFLSVLHPNKHAIIHATIYPTESIVSVSAGLTGAMSHIPTKNRIPYKTNLVGFNLFADLLKSKLKVTSIIRPNC